MTVIDTAAVTALYARQSHAIDEGDAGGWAATFTTDGSFSSPTFGDPVVGTAALTRFAEGVYTDLQKEGIRQRHWLNSIHVDAATQTARAYLMIVRIDADGAPSLMRHVVISDELADASGELLVRARQVRRDP
ncbi:nuclear transport factor 2 family protein [Ornithinimicrobium cavernae]|uniref:nuclear transport factor 2 family protein n=1 Tax=Ornithinimicrobium cavernae TaxID=2666047 RepID=UPI000D694929|nr:nuclear transport factor 2 family protein [Ornithinimicrobium cavernae]